jgi:hypothetical protein
MLWLSAWKNYEESISSTKDIEVTLFGDHVSTGLIHDLAITAQAMNLNYNCITINYMVGQDIAEYEVAEIVDSRRLANLLFYINDVKTNHEDFYYNFLQKQLLGPCYDGTIRHLLRRVLTRCWFERENLTQDPKEKIVILYENDLGNF